MDPAALAAAVAAALDDDVASTGRVGGGDVADSFRLVMVSGRTVFAKTHRDPPPHFFETEASGLEWLRAAGALDVPEVLSVGAGHLALEWVDQGAPGPTTEADLGRGLAALHGAGAAAFGRTDRRTTGSRRLPNEPTDTWAVHFASNRLRPLARLWRATPPLAPETADRLEDLADRLADMADLVVPTEPAARLHGDLWAGNRLIGRGGASWLIDPAAHGGHREFDLAMMLLFGGFGRDCFDAYHDAAPLADGWERRVPLHQLAPLAVHAIKFGGSYEAATVRALDHVDTL